MRTSWELNQEQNTYKMHQEFDWQSHQEDIFREKEETIEKLVCRCNDALFLGDDDLMYRMKYDLIRFLTQ